MKRFLNYRSIIALLVMLGLSALLIDYNVSHALVGEPSRAIISGVVTAKTTNSLTIKSVKVWVNPKTQIYRQVGMTRVTIPFSAILVGQTGTARGFLNADGSIAANVIVMN